MDLMTPRYKVIADWPGSIFRIGEIVNGELYYCDDKGPKYSDWPHLFKRLVWWEDRKREDMPLFIRLTRVGLVKKVEKWHEGLRCFDAMHEGRIYSYDIETPQHESEQRFLPASYEEYLAANPSANQNTKIEDNG